MNSSPPDSAIKPGWPADKRNRPRVILLGPADRPNVSAEVDRLQSLIREHADILAIDLAGQLDLTGMPVDFAIVFGGDGSILRAAKQLCRHQIPALGVNLGKLGFLADLTPDEFVRVLPNVCRGDCRLTENLMLHCEVRRGGTVVAQQVGLNEAAVLAGPPFSMLNVELYVDAVLATTYSCDGLIISTPVGSTAHSLSAGGPILRRNLQAFVISPISPHTLTVRPVVDSADRVFEMVVREPNEMTSLVVDGVVVCRLLADDRVCVERSGQSFRMIEAPEHNYYRTLREKLGWSGNIRRTEIR